MSYFLIMTASDRVHMMTVADEPQALCSARYRRYNVFAIVDKLPSSHTVCDECVANSGITVADAADIANGKV